MLPLLDVVYTFTFDTWTDSVSRELAFAVDRMLDTMMGDDRIGHLLAVNAYRSWPIKLVRRLTGSKSAKFPTSDRLSLLQPYRLQRGDPTSVNAARRQYTSMDDRIRRATRAMGMADPLVVTTNPLLAAFAPMVWARSLTYYGIDDWAAFEPRRRWWPLYEAAYREIGDRGCGVTAVTQAVIDRIRPDGHSVVVPNGINPSEWVDPPDPPAWFMELPAPRLLYVGVIEERVDMRAVVETATRLPGASVVMVGPVMNEAHVAPAKPLPNIHLVPFQGRQVVTGLIHAADVCLIPHRFTNLTRAMSPLKLYEYLAGGTPVVASDLEPMRLDIPQLRLVPEDDFARRFADAVVEMLDAERMTEAERLRFLEANSWTDRLNRLLSLCDPGDHSPDP